MPTDDLKPGLTHTDQRFVEKELTVPGLASRFHEFNTMPSVLASAMMIAFIEHTCIKLLKPYLLPGEATVGTAFNLSHSQATPLSMAVFAEVQLVKIDGRDLHFSIRCYDAEDDISLGTHRRTLINRERFDARLARKAGTSQPPP